MPGRSPCAEGNAEVASRRGSANRFSYSSACHDAQASSTQGCSGRFRALAFQGLGGALFLVLRCPRPRLGQSTDSPARASVPNIEAFGGEVLPISPAEGVTMWWKRSGIFADPPVTLTGPEQRRGEHAARKAARDAQRSVGRTRKGQYRRYRAGAGEKYLDWPRWRDVYLQEYRRRDISDRGQGVDFSGGGSSF